MPNALHSHFQLVDGCDMIAKCTEPSRMYRWLLSENRETTEKDTIDGPQCGNRKCARPGLQRRTPAVESLAAECHEEKERTFSVRPKIVEVFTRQGRRDPKATNLTCTPMDKEHEMLRHKLEKLERFGVKLACPIFDGALLTTLRQGCMEDHAARTQGGIDEMTREHYTKLVAKPWKHSVTHGERRPKRANIAALRWWCARLQRTQV